MDPADKRVTKAVASAAPPRQSSREHAERLIELCALGVLGLVTLLAIYSLWSVPYLPLQDHPSHLLREKILLEYHGAQSPYPRDFVPNAKSVISIAQPILNPVINAPAALVD
jgi:hypothetical protein